MAAHNWRDADLRGAGKRPASVTAVVEQARFGLLAVRLAESLLLGIAGTTATLAAAVVTGARPGLVEAWCVALVAGAAAGLGWWLEHRGERSGIAARLDRRLRHQGALSAAFDAERRGSDTPCARLLRRRVLARLRTREAVRSVLPPLAPPVIAPLLGAFLLATAIERSRVPEGPAPPDAGRLAAGLSAELEGIRSAAVGAQGEEALDASTVRALFALQQRARELAEELDGPEPPADALERLQALDDELFAQAARLGAHPELEKSFSAARSWLDGTRAALEAPGQSAGGGPGGSGTSVAAEGGDGTIPSSLPPERAESDGAPPAPPERVEPGSAATGTWWPREHDPVVERWIEARRAALGRTGEDQAR